MPLKHPIDDDLRKDRRHCRKLLKKCRWTWESVLSSSLPRFCLIQYQELICKITVWLIFEILHGHWASPIFLKDAQRCCVARLLVWLGTSQLNHLHRTNFPLHLKQLKRKVFDNVLKVDAVGRKDVVGFFIFLAENVN